MSDEYYSKDTLRKRIIKLETAVSGNYDYIMNYIGEVKQEIDELNKRTGGKLK